MNIAKILYVILNWVVFIFLAWFTFFVSIMPKVQPEPWAIPLLSTITILYLAKTIFIMWYFWWRKP